MQNWSSVQFDWNYARSFLITAEEGSLSAAARALGLTQPTLGRQVAALEAELGVALFERSSHGLDLTPSGLSLVAHVKAMADAANNLSLEASGQSKSVEGLIRISATEIMSATILPTMLNKLRKKEPGISVDLISSDESSDIRRREADIAIRFYRPNQPDLIAKKLFEDRYRLYAANNYLKTVGMPDSINALNQLEFVGYSREKALLEILNSGGLALEPSNFKVVVQGSLTNWELVKQGLGVGVMSTHIGDHEPLVRPLTVQPELPSADLWLVTHRELRTSIRVQTVFDFLSAELLAWKTKFDYKP